MLKIACAWGKFICQSIYGNFYVDKFWLLKYNNRVSLSGTLTFSLGKERTRSPLFWLANSERVPTKPALGLVKIIPHSSLLVNPKANKIFPFGYAKLKSQRGVFIKRILTGFLSGILNGLLGSGGGVVVVLSLRKFLGLEGAKAHGTAVAVMLPLTLLSAAIYLGKEQTDLLAALWITLGGICGGVAGAKLLKKISGPWLHRIFGAVMIFGAVRMLWA